MYIRTRACVMHIPDCPTSGRPLVGISGCKAAAISARSAKKFGCVFTRGRKWSRSILQLYSPNISLFTVFFVFVLGQLVVGGGDLEPVCIYHRIRTIRQWAMHLRNPPKKGVGL